MASPDVELITFWASPYGLRADFALIAKGVPYERLLEIDHVNQKSKRLLEANPVHKKIPVLIHKGKPIPESLILIEYIDEVWPSPDGKDLLPKDPYKRAVARFWADYVDKKLCNSLRPLAFGPKEEHEKAKGAVLEELATLEGAFPTISEGGPFFGGENPGLVDMIMGPLVAWFPTYEAIGGIQFQFEEKFPHIHKWIGAIKASKCGTCLQDGKKITEFVMYVRTLIFPEPKESIMNSKVLTSEKKITTNIGEG